MWFNLTQLSFFNGVKAGIWLGRMMNDKQLIEVQVHIQREEAKYHG